MTCDRFPFARLAAVAFVLAPLLTGCGGKDYRTAPVSGRVTLDGRPLADVGITFVPLAKDRKDPRVGPGSLGRTDAEGRFSLKTVEGDRGAVPAEHVVRMSMAEAPRGQAGGDGLALPQAAARTPLPRAARDGTLRFTVPPEGTDEADFELVSGQGAR